MNVKLLTTLTIAILLLTACGDDSTSSSESLERQIKKKDFIQINQHQKNCVIIDKEKLARNLESYYGFPRLINHDTMISFNKDTTQFCENYGRTLDFTTCGVLDAKVATEKTCVTGFDFEK